MMHPLFLGFPPLLRELSILHPPPPALLPLAADRRKSGRGAQNKNSKARTQTGSAPKKLPQLLRHYLHQSTCRRSNKQFLHIIHQQYYNIIRRSNYLHFVNTRAATKRGTERGKSTDEQLLRLPTAHLKPITPITPFPLHIFPTFNELPQFHEAVKHSRIVST